MWVKKNKNTDEKSALLKEVELTLLLLLLFLSCKAMKDYERKVKWCKMVELNLPQEVTSWCIAGALPGHPSGRATGVKTEPSQTY